MFAECQIWSGRNTYTDSNSIETDERHNPRPNPAHQKIRSEMPIWPNYANSSWVRLALGFTKLVCFNSIIIRVWVCFPIQPTLTSRDNRNTDVRNKQHALKTKTSRKPTVIHLSPPLPSPLRPPLLIPCPPTLAGRHPRGVWFRSAPTTLSSASPT